MAFTRELPSGKWQGLFKTMDRRNKSAGTHDSQEGALAAATRAEDEYWARVGPGVRPGKRMTRTWIHTRVPEPADFVFPRPEGWVHTTILHTHTEAGEPVHVNAWSFPAVDEANGMAQFLVELAEEDDLNWRVEVVSSPLYPRHPDEVELPPPRPDEDEGEWDGAFDVRWAELDEDD